MKRAYWIRFHWGECPVCGRDASYSERVYGAKPADPLERHKQLNQTETYDHCLELEALR